MSTPTTVRACARARARESWTRARTTGSVRFRFWIGLDWIGLHGVRIIRTRGADRADRADAWTRRFDAHPRARPNDRGDADTFFDGGGV